MTRRQFQLGDTPTEAIRDNLEAEGWWRDALEPGWRLVPAKERYRPCRDCRGNTPMIHPDGHARHRRQCTKGPRR